MAVSQTSHCIVFHYMYVANQLNFANWQWQKWTDAPSVQKKTRPQTVDLVGNVTVEERKHSTDLTQARHLQRCS